MKQIAIAFVMLAVMATIATAEQPREYLVLIARDIPRDCAPFEAPPCVTTQQVTIGPGTFEFVPGVGMVAVWRERSRYLIMAIDGESGATRPQNFGGKQTDGKWYWDGLRIESYVPATEGKTEGLVEILAACTLGMLSRDATGNAFISDPSLAAAVCREHADAAMADSVGLPDPSRKDVHAFNRSDWRLVGR